MFLFLFFLVAAFGKPIISVDTVDYIVIGGGSAGGTIASGLSTFFKVQLLEAGSPDSVRHRAISTPDDSVWGTSLDWQMNTVAKSGLLTLDGSPRSDHWPRGKTWGGCSSINAMLYVRGQHEGKWR